MIDEVESKHLQLLISRAFRAIIGKKCLHYNWYNSKERSTAGEGTTWSQLHSVDKRDVSYS